MKTISEALAEQTDAIANLYRAQELAKVCIEKIKKMQRELLHEQKQRIMFGWHKPVASKPVTRQKAAPNWHRIRSFCQRRQPPDPKC